MMQINMNKGNATQATSEIRGVSAAVMNFCNTFHGEASKNIFVGTHIPHDALAVHKEKYLSLDRDENVLVLLNKGSIYGSILGNICFTGLAITNTKIHFCTVRKSFFGPIPPAKKNHGQQDDCRS